MFTMTLGELAEMAVVLYQAMEHTFPAEIDDKKAAQFIHLAIANLEDKGVIRVEGAERKIVH